MSKRPVHFYSILSEEEDDDDDEARKRTNAKLFFLYSLFPMTTTTTTTTVVDVFETVSAIRAEVKRQKKKKTPPKKTIMRFGKRKFWWSEDYYYYRRRGGGGGGGKDRFRRHHGRTAPRTRELDRNRARTERFCRRERVREPDAIAPRTRFRRIELLKEDVEDCEFEGKSPSVRVRTEKSLFGKGMDPSECARVSVPNVSRGLCATTRPHFFGGASRQSF